MMISRISNCAGRHPRLLHSLLQGPIRTLSTAPRKRILQDKDPISVTPAAAERIKELLQQKSGPVGIRLGVKRRGCNGLSYTLNYVDEGENEALDKRKRMHLVESEGVHVYVEPMAFFHVVGTEMDWEETELTSEFTFRNPNAKGECGCGESFNV